MITRGRSMRTFAHRAAAELAGEPGMPAVPFGLAPAPTGAQRAGWLGTREGAIFPAGYPESLAVHCRCRSFLATAYLPAPP
jgi:hypothetical protein